MIKVTPTTVIHVCRKRLEKPEPVSWAKMRRWVREEAARLKTLLDWIVLTDLDPDVREAAALAKNILASWRAKQAGERAHRPDGAQLELQLAQSDA